MTYIEPLLQIYQFGPRVLSDVVIENHRHFETCSIDLARFRNDRRVRQPRGLVYSFGTRGSRTGHDVVVLFLIGGTSRLQRLKQSSVQRQPNTLVYILIASC